METRKSGKYFRERTLLWDGKKLKYFGCITAFCYTFSMSIFQNGLLRIGDFEHDALSAAMASNSRFMVLSGWAAAFQLIGGLSVPIFAFLLVEGFLHTSSYKRYILAVLLCGVVSEIPYDLATYGKAVEWSGQNVMFTYVICLIMLYGLRMLENRNRIYHHIIRAAIILAAVLWENLLRGMFGLCSVLLCAIYYLCYDRKGVRILLGACVSVLYVTAPLSAYLLWNYSGQRGEIKYKYLPYALYPVHLLILGICSALLANYA